MSTEDGRRVEGSGGTRLHRGFLKLSGSTRGRILAAVDLLVTDPVSGRTTGLARTVRRALEAMEPKHLGDFAAIVQSGRADLGAAERKLAAMHPEMLGEWSRRVREAQHPAPPPPRPAPRRRRT